VSRKAPTLFSAWIWHNFRQWKMAEADGPKISRAAAMGVAVYLMTWADEKKGARLWLSNKQVAGWAGCSLRSVVSYRGWLRDSGVFLRTGQEVITRKGYGVPIEMPSLAMLVQWRERPQPATLDMTGLHRAWCAFLAGDPRAPRVTGEDTTVPQRPAAADLSPAAAAGRAIDSAPRGEAARPVAPASWQQDRAMDEMRRRWESEAEARSAAKPAAPELKDYVPSFAQAG
jgi:hypothetical protein